MRRWWANVVPTRGTATSQTTVEIFLVLPQSSWIIFQKWLHRLTGNPFIEKAEILTSESNCESWRGKGLWQLLHNPLIRGLGEIKHSNFNFRRQRVKLYLDRYFVLCENRGWNLILRLKRCNLINVNTREFILKNLPQLSSHFEGLPLRSVAP